MGGYKTWAALEEVTAANMNTYVRDNTVPQFASAAARSAAIASPVVGTMSYLADTGSLEVYYGATTGWARPWNRPWGVPSGAYSKQTAAQTGLAAITDVTGDGTGSKCSITWTALAGRRYRLTGRLVTQSASVPSTSVLYITTGANVEVGRSVEPTANASYGNQHLAVTIVEPSAGSVTYKLRIEPVTANVDTVYTAASPGFIIAEDIGPTGNAPTA